MIKQKQKTTIIPWLLFIPIGLAVLIVWLVYEEFTPQAYLAVIITTSTLVLTTHGIFSLIWMLYAWGDPEQLRHQSSPKKYGPPTFSFTAIVAAREEQDVIADTIEAMARINYPAEMVEILIVCRSDDPETLAEVKKVINMIRKPTVRLIVFDDEPINKPHALNIGLRQATKDVVVVFDAEDEPHPDIFNIVNTVMINSGAEVVQSGVQLMNYRDRWFTALNVLEYFFWYKSGLHYFSRVGNVTPLGGNTIFVKREKLTEVGGWKEECLTEDADLGIRLSLAKAAMSIIYDGKHATKEEAPITYGGLIKQRTRWIQGFLQILSYNDWRQLPQWKQQFFALFILFSPSLQIALLAYVPVAIWIAFTQKLPLALSLFSYIPLYLFGMQLLVYGVGLYEFTKTYKLHFSWWMPVWVVLMFIPYQILLDMAAVRAWYRFLRKERGWEKTVHTNAHRKPWLGISVAYVD